MKSRKGRDNMRPERMMRGVMGREYKEKGTERDTRRRGYKDKRIQEVVDCSETMIHSPIIISYPHDPLTFTQLLNGFSQSPTPS